MATVYLGREEGGRIVALKVIKDEFVQNTEFVAMFHDEARLISKIIHPNVVRVHEIGSEGDRLFIAMEHLEGQSLWNLWEACRKRGVRIRYDLIAWICARVAEGVHHAHELRDASGNSLAIVHRDLNASNVIIGYDGKVTVIDFGLAKALNKGAKTAAGVVKGKLAYLSPEQVEGKAIDRRSDVFTLGITLWEIGCDRRLFKGEDDMATVRKVHATVVPDPITVVTGFPQGLATIIKKCLARRPEDRFATAAEVAHALEAFVRVEWHGSAPGQSALAELMGQMFGHERSKQERWISTATAADSAQGPSGGPALPTLWPKGQTGPMPTMPPPARVPAIFPEGTQPRAVAARVGGSSSHPPPLFNPPPPSVRRAIAGPASVPPKAGVGVAIVLLATLVLALAAVGLVVFLRSR